MCNATNNSEWWSQQHRTPGSDVISGTSGEEVVSGLRIAELIVPGSQVLEIGVGQGTCTRWLAERCRVSALDVCLEALAKVADVITHGYLLPTELPTNVFQVVISHLVCQHLDDETLTFQVQEVLRSIAPTGVFALQFAEAWNPLINNQPATLERMRGGGVCRTPSHMFDLLRRAGWQVVEMFYIRSFPEWQSSWYGIQARHHEAAEDGKV